MFLPNRLRLVSAPANGLNIGGIFKGSSMFKSLISEVNDEVIIIYA